MASVTGALPPAVGGDLGMYAPLASDRDASLWLHASCGDEKLVRGD